MRAKIVPQRADKAARISDKTCRTSARVLRRWPSIPTTRIVAVQRFDHVLVSAGPGRRKQGHAVRRPFFGIDRDDFLAVDIGLHLPPELALRSASGQANLFARECSFP